MENPYEKRPQPPRVDSAMRSQAHKEGEKAAEHATSGIRHPITGKIEAMKGFMPKDVPLTGKGSSAPRQLIKAARSMGKGDVAPMSGPLQPKRPSVATGRINPFTAAIGSYRKKPSPLAREYEKGYRREAQKQAVAYAAGKAVQAGLQRTVVGSVIAWPAGKLTQATVKEILHNKVLLGIIIAIFALLILPITLLFLPLIFIVGLAWAVRSSVKEMMENAKA